MRAGGTDVELDEDNSCAFVPFCFSLALSLPPIGRSGNDPYLKCLLSLPPLGLPCLPPEH